MSDATERTRDDELVRLVQAKESHRLLLLSKPNVIAMDIGQRVRDGQQTSEPVVTVYVSRKVDRSLLSEEQLIPPTLTIDGAEVHTDVREGEIDEPHVFVPRERPLHGGLSISAGGGTGTLGICLRPNDRNTYVLSCNHVLATSVPAVLGGNVIQPGALDGGTPTTDVIGTVSRVAPIDFGSTTINVGGVTVTIPNPNRVDAALALVRPDIEGNREIFWLGYPQQLLPVAPNIFKLLSLTNRRVCKMGRTTEFTTGIIQSAFFDVTVGPYQNGRNAFFTNQLRIVGENGQTFSERGDSGSVVIDYETREPLGLLFSGGGVHTNANRLYDVLTALRLDQM